MASAYGSAPWFPSLMMAPAVFAFGLVAFGFLGMGPVTIAVDSYGPVTDNAQSVYELSTIETLPGIKQEPREEGLRLHARLRKAKENLEENDGAGNTFKATSKPVLIGTAVVGATTMIFSIIVALTNGLQEPTEPVDPAPPFLLGHDRGRRGDLLVHRRQRAGGHHRRLSRGRIHQEEHQAGERREGLGRRFKKVVAICTQYAQKGMFNIFLTVFFATLAFAFSSRSSSSAT
jgi:K(+)-stimulated pyrophosphate-energized sodium pump